MAACRGRAVRCITTTKNSGTKKIASTVADIIPPMTAVPSACCAPEPAPEPITIGNTPSVNASEVIKIGRKRSRAASIAASLADLPWVTSSLANSMIKIAFLADKPNIVHLPGEYCTSQRP